MSTSKDSSGSRPLREDLNDLGFGSRLTQTSGQRLLNRNGSFNVKREGLSLFRSSGLYHRMLTMRWSLFHCIVVLFFIIFNTIFATGYLLCGEGALKGATGVTPVERFLDAFFFSVQTSSTIGYGHITPFGVMTNTLVSAEVMTGLLGFALATSLVFARFSRPNARIMFSDRAVIAPYRDMTALEFRMINERSNQLIQLEIKVLLSRMESHGGKKVRRFHDLRLERNQVVFFPLNWTVVHPIDTASPLSGVTEKEFLSWDPEIMILLTGIDETFSQTVHARSSYKGEEVVWGAKFGDMYQRSDGGVISVDLKRLHAIESVSLG
jgi:inward rectifier potassium channel